MREEMMAAVVQSAKPLIDPFDGIRPAVEARRWVLPALALAFSVSFSGASFASRWDAAPVVMQQLEKAGELQKVTEQELFDKIQTTRRLRLVAGVAKGVFLAPVALLLIALVLQLSAWVFSQRTGFSKFFSVASLSLLPVALFHVLFAICALRQFSVSDPQYPLILPSSLAAVFPNTSPPLQGLLSGVDLFNIWSAVLLGLGFSAASGMKRAKAVLLGLGLYAAYVGVFLVGIPGLMAGRGA
jgi:hypothetical protein